MNSRYTRRHTAVPQLLVAVACLAIALPVAAQESPGLAAPIQQYVPSFPGKPWPITTRQLLAHQSGIRHNDREGEITQTRHYTNVTEPLRIFQDEPLLFEPGTKFAYSSYGYALLGAVVEGAAGMPFTEYLREHLFKPTGMSQTRADDVWAIIPRRAQGYRKTARGEWLNSPLADTSNRIAGGGLCSTVEDLARFASALQSGAVLKPPTLEMMFTRQKMTNGRQTDYGLGWFVAGTGPRKEVEHPGNQPRVSGWLYLLPERGCAVAVIANLEDAGLGDLVRRIATIALQ